jgi:hypothetical protein
LSGPPVAGEPEAIPGETILRRAEHRIDRVAGAASGRPGAAHDQPGDWRAHLLARLTRQVEVSADPVLAALLKELRAYPAPRGPAPEMPAAAIPFEFAADAGKLSFISMTAVFGTPMDITLSELAIECFYPANEATAKLLAGKMLGQAV